MIERRQMFSVGNNNNIRNPILARHRNSFTSCVVYSVRVYLHNILLYYVLKIHIYIYMYITGVGIPVVFFSLLLSSSSSPSLYSPFLGGGDMLHAYRSQCTDFDKQQISKSVCVRVFFFCDSESPYGRPDGRLLLLSAVYIFLLNVNENK